MNNALNMDEGSIPDLRTFPENTLVNGIERPMLSPGSYCTFALLCYKPLLMQCPAVTEVSTKPTPPRPARKRRRRHKHRVSTSSYEYGTVATGTFSSNVIHGEHGMTKRPAPSETSIEAMFSGVEPTSSPSKISNWGFNNNRATILEEELEKEKADHQKTKEELDRAMADILDLQEQVEKLQVANKRTSQQYDGLARDLVHEKVLLEANLTHQRPTPQRYHSTLLHSNEVEELNHTRQSRNVRLRPLSIIQSTKASETLAAQSRSLPSSHNATLPRLRFPVATGSSTESRSTATGSRTSTIPSTSRVPSGGISGGLTVANHTGQFRPGSSGSHMTQNVNTAVKKGFQGLKHKFSNQFIRHDREEKINTAQPAPALESLPALPPSVSLQRQMSHILIDGNKRHTDDSGYASIELERFSSVLPEDSR
jgi:hypothetical protein